MFCTHSAVLDGLIFPCDLYIFAFRCTIRQTQPPLSCKVHPPLCHRHLVRLCAVHGRYSCGQGLPWGGGIPDSREWSLSIFPTPPPSPSLAYLIVPPGFDGEGVTKSFLPFSTSPGNGLAEERLCLCAQRLPHPVLLFQEQLLHRPASLLRVL